MQITIERPPVAATPPALPPFLTRKRGGPERRVVILPDIRFGEQCTRIQDRENNWYTIVYQWMVRITGESMFDDEAKWELAHTSMRKYRSWLETYDMKDNIPPHIQFGGAIEVGERDETFYPRWIKYAQETFA